MGLRRISYRSARVPGLTDDELMTGLIIPAAARNAREGITGCLWTGEHSFVQVIEGREHAVHDLMARIVADPRHNSLRLLMNCTARFRLFESWGLKWVKSNGCVVVEDLAEAIASRAPRKDVALDNESAPSRMSQIVTALVSAQGELP